MEDLTASLEQGKGSAAPQWTKGMRYPEVSFSIRYPASGEDRLKRGRYVFADLVCTHLNLRFRAPVDHLQSQGGIAQLTDTDLEYGDVCFSHCYSCLAVTQKIVASASDGTQRSWVVSPEVLSVEPGDF